VASTRGVHRILVADDDPQILTLVREALAADGHFVALAPDGAEALRALEAAKFSLLVVDFQMPHKTGLDVLKTLRGRGAVTPVILMSSLLPDEARRLAAEDERLALLEKPFSIADLRSAVGALTRVRA
jgi:DNA-binding response OmpR family regulator